MRLVLISDTHNRYEPKLPDGDILIHAGDLSMEGRPDEIFSSINWLSRQRDRYKAVLAIAGNHDFFAERYPATVATYCGENGVTYLQNESAVIDGILFWGSPLSPWFNDWAFGPHRGPDIREYWDRIPVGTDVLITHGPPARVLDLCRGGRGGKGSGPVGCEDLREVIYHVRPQLHVFGHIHEGRGETELHGLPTRFVNASCLTEYYTPAKGDIFTFDIG